MFINNVFFQKEMHIKTCMKGLHIKNSIDKYLVGVTSPPPSKHSHSKVEGRFIYYCRVVNNYLKLGGQVVMPDAAAAASALLFRQTWVGNCLFCPPTHH